MKHEQRIKKLEKDVNSLNVRVTSIETKLTQVMNGISKLNLVLQKDRVVRYIVWAILLIILFAILGK